MGTAMNSKNQKLCEENIMNISDNLQTDLKRTTCWSGQRLILVLFTVLSLAGLLPQTVIAAEQTGSDDWQFGIEAYFWGASIGGEAATGSDVDIGIDDLIDQLDLGFMTALGARKGKWSFVVDVIYLDVSDNTNVQIENVGVNTNVELQGLVVTPVAGYQIVSNEIFNADVIAGARYLGLDSDVTLRNADPGATSFNRDGSTSGGIWDAIIGLRGDINFAQNWYIPLRIDVGTGDSELAWHAHAGLGYRFEYCDVVLSYRYLDWDFDDNDVFDDLNFSGPMAGVKFYF